MTIPTITDDLIAEIEKEFRHAYERNSVPDVSPEEGLDLIAHIKEQAEQLEYAADLLVIAHLEKQGLEKDAARYRKLRNNSLISAPRDSKGVALPLYATNEQERIKLDAHLDAMQATQ